MAAIPERRKKIKIYDVMASSYDKILLNMLQNQKKVSAYTSSKVLEQAVLALANSKLDIPYHKM